MIDIIERDIYALICSADRIKAKDIAKKLNKERSMVNHYLYASQGVWSRMSYIKEDPLRFSLNVE